MIEIGAVANSKKSLFQDHNKRKSKERRQEGVNGEAERTKREQEGGEWMKTERRIELEGEEKR